MQKVDNWLQEYYYFSYLLFYIRFENIRLQAVEDYEEIEKLTTWYEYFLKSY
jgi:hypothetical protein